MRSQLPEHALVTLLRECFVTPGCQTLRPAASRSCSRLFQTAQYHGRPSSSTVGGQQRRIHTNNSRTSNLQTRFSTIGISSPSDNVLRASSNGTTSSSKNPPPTAIAVLGGGITGLATAHYITKFLPEAHVTIYEGSERLGGWLKSTKVETSDGIVHFEHGPRNLRPNTPASLATLEIVQDLGLEDEILVTPKTSPAATNRFIYYPDHLVKMPGPGQDPWQMTWDLLTEPVFAGLLRGAIFEFTRDPRPGMNELEADESIGSFLARRLGSENPGNNIVSAVLHGIYAGDLYKLSVRSLMPYFYHMEGQAGSLSKALVNNMSVGERTLLSKDAALQNKLVGTLEPSLADQMTGASVYSFKGGIGTFATALEGSLKTNPHVTINTDTQVKFIKYDKEKDNIKIGTIEKPTEEEYTHCISTLPAPALSRITPVREDLSMLATIPYVTVMVVNLYYPDPHILSEPGFGYLIPRSIAFDQNPECALGVVFDSYASIGQDTAKGTKITVMLGGHWWDSFSANEFPTEEEGVEMAKAVLKRHLKIDGLPEQTLASLQRSCIPQYVVGHEQVLRSANRELRNKFGGKLSVAANWVDGVGLNDCVRGARELVERLKNEGVEKGVQVVTGLEEFAGQRVWVQAKTEARIRFEKQREEKERGGEE